MTNVIKPGSREAATAIATASEVAKAHHSLHAGVGSLAKLVGITNPNPFVGVKAWLHADFNARHIIDLPTVSPECIKADLEILLEKIESFQYKAAKAAEYGQWDSVDHWEASVVYAKERYSSMHAKMLEAEAAIAKAESTPKVTPPASLMEYLGLTRQDLHERMPSIGQPMYLGKKLSLAEVKAKYKDLSKAPRQECNRAARRYLRALARMERMESGAPVGEDAVKMACLDYKPKRGPLPPLKDGSYLKPLLGKFKGLTPAGK